MSLNEIVVTVYRGALPTMLVSGLGGLFAGSILSGMTGELEAVRGLLVMVPAFLAIRGSVYGSLGSRLSSALHQGLIEPKFTYDGRVANSILAALINGLTASIVVAGLTVGILSALGLPVAPLMRLLLIAVIAGLLAGIALAVVIVLVVFAGYREGLDPDNLVGPAMTTAGDIFGMASLFIATRVALGIG